MSLLFGNTGSADRVDIGDGTSIRDLNPFTFIEWIYPVNTGTWAGKPFLQKGRAAGGGSRRVLEVSASGNFMRLEVDRSTSDTNYIASNLAMSNNTWYCVAGTYDSAASPTTHLYQGTLSAVMVEATYSTSTDGSGTLGSDSGQNMRIGNDGAASPTSSINARIATVGIFNRVLSLGELIDWQFRPGVRSGCVGFYQLGFNGISTQPDWSGNGNSGTVTTVEVADHVPVRGWAARRRLDYSPYFVAAVAASTARLYKVTQAVPRAANF